jgi:hypothetical protein
MYKTDRSLVLLSKVSSTSRVLNLGAINRRIVARDGDGAFQLFENPRLNRSIIVKHRVRAEERALFDLPPPVATKVLFPIDENALRAGAWRLLCGQTDFDTSASALVGSSLREGARDRQILDLIAALPSLDPFILREALKRIGIEPAADFLVITEADVARMHQFVCNEMEQLVQLSRKGDRGSIQACTERFVDKLLSVDASRNFSMIQQLLHIPTYAFQDGISAWRGYLYYKWLYSTMEQPIREIIADLKAVRNRSLMKKTINSKIVDEKIERVEACLFRSIRHVEDSIERCDDMYGNIVRTRSSEAFRQFISFVPTVLPLLGEVCSTLQDSASYWKYRFECEAQRFALARPIEIVEELEEILLM